MKSNFLDSLSDKKFQNAWDDILEEAAYQDGTDKEIAGYYCTFEDFTR